ncbi:MAG: hypothetical protein ACTSRE_11440 [Promethearchaeota archaeon]
MTDMNKNGSRKEPFQDLKHSFRLLFKNYKPFLKVQLFAFSLALLTFFIIIGIGFVYWAIWGTVPYEEPIRYVGGAFITIFGGFIWVFLTSSNGLAVELIDSGNEFTEFRNSFRYFAKYWWQYALIAIIVFGFPSVIQGIITHPRVHGALQDMPWEKVLIYETAGLILSYIFYSLFMLLFPSITSQGRLKHAFIENFRILKSNGKRVFVTWALFFLVFHIPVYLFASLTLIFQTPLFSIFWVIFMLIQMLVGMPLQYLMAAGMYFNIDFERFKPID